MPTHVDTNVVGAPGGPLHSSGPPPPRGAPPPGGGPPRAPHDELSLPHPPGVLRRFWARHPRLTDVLVAVLAFALSAPTAAIRSGYPTAPTAAQTWLALALVVVASGALLFRRRRPLLVLAVAAAPTVILPPSLVPVFHILPAFAIYAVAVYRSTRACWVAFAIASGCMAAYTAVFALLSPSELGYLITSLVSQVMTMLIGSLFGINVGARRRYLTALIDRSRQLLVERDQQAQLAAAAERTRIAREMHDIVSHSLTVIVALSEGAAAASTPERARQASASAAETARAALDEMRAMLGVLRSDADDSSPLQPLEPVEPAEVVAAAQRAGYPVASEITGRLSDVPRAVRFALGRVVQESVTNAMRHAPRARMLRVAVEVGAGDVRVEVLNDGAPTLTSPRPPGYGLQGLRERVEHVGGTIEAGPLADSQWRVFAVLPFTTVTVGDAR